MKGFRNIKKTKRRVKKGVPTSSQIALRNKENSRQGFSSQAADKQIEYEDEEEDYYDSDNEGDSGYRKGGYHPVQVGDKFKDGRYIVLRKLGWGHFSTVWLVNDQQNNSYAALKVQKGAQQYTEAAQDEIVLLSQIADGDTKFAQEVGENYVRQNFCCVRLMDNFEHSGPNGKHVCMVFEVLGENLLSLIKMNDYQGIPIDVVRNISKQVLIGLDYIHRCKQIIHTDLKPENVMFLRPLHSRSWPTPELIQAETRQVAPSPLSQSDTSNLTKNQKKKLKKKLKKSAAAAASQTVSDTTATSTSTASQNNYKTNSLKQKQLQQDEEFHSQQNQRQLLENGKIAVNSDLKDDQREQRNEQDVHCKQLANHDLCEDQDMEDDSNNQPRQQSRQHEEKSTFKEVQKVSNQVRQENQRIDANASNSVFANSAKQESDAETGNNGDTQNVRNIRDKRTCSSRDVSMNGRRSMDVQMDEDSQHEEQLSVQQERGQSKGGYCDEDQQLSTEFHCREEGMREDELVEAECKIVDFGNACWTHKHFTDDIQTRQYRSPEVILGQGYDTSADIWSFACMVFELITGDMLFNPKSGKRYCRDEDHLALIIELLGYMPKWFCLKGRYSREFFNRQGELRNIKDLRFFSLDRVLVEKYKMDEDEAIALTDFLLPMLECDPAKRINAQEALQHPWLRGETRFKPWIFRPYMSIGYGNNQSADNGSERSPSRSPKRLSEGRMDQSEIGMKGEERGGQEGEQTINEERGMSGGDSIGILQEQQGCYLQQQFQLIDIRE
eukprot:TRINITY_DN11539_c1_g1_i1.p1 TRINITY_DN11539_c1_g1~~TRINITY_DN11539_c1_g1_i1.p1  ORF type:complete len:781 (-),score=104.12 TRINITY_DN11539_c1_g1_i1:169-2511(-)